MSNHPTKRRMGSAAEKQACLYLQSQGLKLLQSNYHCPAGEIDLIMEHNGAVIFVEVRMRKNDHFGSAAESVDARKQQKIQATALHYLQRHPRQAKQPARFDVVAITSQANDPMQWIQNAFEA